MSKRYLTGGGKDPKNQRKSGYYFYKTFSFVKFYIKKTLTEKKRRLLCLYISDDARRCRCRLLYRKLTFVAYDRPERVGSRGARFLEANKKIASLLRARFLCTRFLNVRFMRNHFVRARLLCNSFLHDSIKIFQKSGLRLAWLTSLIQKPHLRAANCGAILIEFAVCMPILIILLFYIHDLIRIKRYYSQTEFVAQQFANIIQNISQKRTNKKITVPDIKYAASLAYLSMYPGTTMYRVGTSGARHTLSHAPRLNIYYVKGLSGGKASCLWMRRFLSEGANDPSGWSSSGTVGSSSVTSVCANTDTTPSNIYKNLKISEGEEKIIVEANIFISYATINANDYVESDKQEALAKKAFKCRLVAPKPLEKNVNARQGWYFTSVVVFTPKPGLFNETPPAES